MPHQSMPQLMVRLHTICLQITKALADAYPQHLFPNTDTRISVMTSVNASPIWNAFHLHGVKRLTLFGCVTFNSSFVDEIIKKHGFIPIYYYNGVSI
jgi:hypothetical protein